MGDGRARRPAAAVLRNAHLRLRPLRLQRRLHAADDADRQRDLCQQADSRRTHIHEIRLRHPGTALLPHAGAAQTTRGRRSGVQLPLRLEKRRNRIQDKLCVHQAMHRSPRRQRLDKERALCQFAHGRNGYTGGFRGHAAQHSGRVAAGAEVAESRTVRRQGRRMDDQGLRPDSGAGRRVEHKDGQGQRPALREGDRI